MPVVLIVGNPIKALEEICTERKMEYPVRMDITPECATFEWKSNISSNTYGVSYQIIEVQVQEV